MRAIHHSRHSRLCREGPCWTRHRQSSDQARSFTASEGKRPHTQTVAYVMDFLDELGKKNVQQKKRRGKKFIVVDPEAATRYAAHHDRCDGESGLTTDLDVISVG
jgi:hypothetical protein